MKKIFGIQNFLSAKLITLIVFAVSKFSSGQTNTFAVFQVNPKVSYIFGNNNNEKIFGSKAKPSFGLNIDLGIRKIYKRKIQIDYLISYNDFQIVQNKRELYIGEAITGNPLNFKGGWVDYNVRVQFKSIDFLLYTGLNKQISSRLTLDASLGAGVGYLAEARVIQTLISKDKSYEDTFIKKNNKVFTKINFVFGTRLGLGWKLNNRMNANFLINYGQHINTIYSIGKHKIFPNATGLTIGIGYLLNGSKIAKN